ncbi:MAG: precorrin-6A reductase [Lachnospiraceae bacterium]|nr:precorrin-6A reductase [Lachnospiraceae bacterium]
MKKIMIFSGTTEGRILASKLCDGGINTDVCVASDYGRDMMESNPYMSVHTGRMDALEMTEFMKAKGYGWEDIIIDATHPYATEVTNNIKTAAGICGSEYIRVVRDRDKTPDGMLNSYPSVEECSAAFAGSEGNILITTGSKELSLFCSKLSEETLKRCFVRVLPTETSLLACREAGIDQSNIIAMHGPFSRELNKAIIKQYDIKHLVTKESGAAGGYEEKIQACLELGIMAHVIERPSAEKGISLNKAYDHILDSIGYKPGLKIWLCGYGPGNPDLNTNELKQIINKAEVIFGSKRLLENIKHDNKYDKYLAKDIIPVLKNNSGYVNAVVLFSGDSGFCSGAKKAYSELSSEFPDAVISILPGISAVSVLAARCHESYEDAVIYSLHGKNDANALYYLLELIRYNRKVFTLVSDASDICRLSRLMLDNGIDCDMTVGRNLSYENEEIISLKAKEAVDYSAEGSLTLFLKNEAYLKEPVIRVLRDEQFLRGSIPMTKECIRHESIIRLKLKKGEVMYDVGGGTGSVSIEAAYTDLSVSVYTFERKEEAVLLIEENIKRLKLPNVKVIEGIAPFTFEALPLPDCVFVGGSGGQLKDIIAYLNLRKKGIRYVINSVSLETLKESTELMEEYGAKEIMINQIAVNNLELKGGYHMFMAQNPVFIISFVL